MNIGTKMLPIQNSYWVIPGRFKAGEHPAVGSTDGTKLKLRWLMGQGINFIVDLTESGEADVDYLIFIQNEASSFNIQLTYKRFPIPDWHTPAQEKMVEILDTIDGALAEGKNIYLHCYGGLGRTGTTVGCYLARHGYAGNKALDRIMKLRSEITGTQKLSPETAAQRKMVMEWTK
jgi:protein-tyrosine phosphatase